MSYAVNKKNCITQKEELLWKTYLICSELIRTK